MRKKRTRREPPPQFNTARIEHYREGIKQRQMLKDKRYESTFISDRELNEGLANELSTAQELVGVDEAKEPNSD
jgi:hypothetical protein